MSGLRVYVTEDASHRARGAAQASVPFEIGGILIGVVTDEGVWVNDFVVIPGRARHQARYMIPAGATHLAVDLARRSDARLGYLGDWHTHPADIGPSGVDFATLRDLASGPFRSRRLLGLLRRIGSGWNLDLWALDRLRSPTRIAYELAGPVPIQDSPSPQ